MERLISLFREPDYDSPAAQDEDAQRPAPQQVDEEPVYFRQLLEYLRQRKADALDDSEVRA